MKFQDLINEFKKEDIRYALSKMHLPTSGTKGVLVDRLNEQDNQETILEAFHYLDIQWICEKLGLPSSSTKADHIKSLLSEIKDKEISPPENTTNPIELLESMVGLQSVKEHIKRIDALLKVQKARKSVGLQEVKVSKHMVFTGNPGTGKTTVAKIVAEIFKNFDFLTKGELIEATRSDFIGAYLGESEEKTAQLFNKAKGGILFIDEAYSIFQGDGDQYGKAILPAFLTNLENHRDDMVVIIAGYKDEMEIFLDSDPGLRSRFSEFIHFEDFSADELTQLFSKVAEEKDYQISEALYACLVDYSETEKQSANFSNGRFVRNTIEKLIQNHALRVADNLDNCSESDLQTLCKEDL